MCGPQRHRIRHRGGRFCEVAIPHPLRAPVQMRFGRAIGQRTVSRRLHPGGGKLLALAEPLEGSWRKAACRSARGYLAWTFRCDHMLSVKVVFRCQINTCGRIRVSF